MRRYNMAMDIWGWKTREEYNEWMRKRKILWDRSRLSVEIEGRTYKQKQIGCIIRIIQDFMSGLRSCEETQKFLQKAWADESYNYSIGDVI